MNKFSMPIGILPRGDKNFQKKLLNRENVIGM